MLPAITLRSRIALRRMLHHFHLHLHVQARRMYRLLLRRSTRGQVAPEQREQLVLLDGLRKVDTQRGETTLEFQH